MPRITGILTSLGRSKIASLLLRPVQAYRNTNTRTVHTCTLGTPCPISSRSWYKTALSSVRHPSDKAPLTRDAARLLCLPTECRRATRIYFIGDIFLGWGLQSCQWCIWKSGTTNKSCSSQEVGNGVPWAIIYNYHTAQAGIIHWPRAFCEVCITKPHNAHYALWDP